MTDILPALNYTTLLKHKWSAEELEKFTRERAEAIEFDLEKSNWQSIYDAYIEYFKASLFVDLRDGRLQDSGIKLTGGTIDEIDSYIEKNNIELHKHEFEPIPSVDWNLSNINWDSNILYVEQFAYFWIRFSVPETGLFSSLDFESRFGIPEAENV